MTDNCRLIYNVVRGTEANLAYNAEFLQYLLEQGKINATDELVNFEMLKRQKILSEHKYSIWYSKKEEVWYTHLPDEDRPDKRRKVKKKNKKDLENVICAYYTEQDSRDKLTVAELYTEWLKYKNLHVRSSGTMKRISAAWKKYYKEDEISRKKVQDLTELYLDEWIHEKIQNYHFNTKQYYNMSLPMRQMMEFAVKKKYIDVNLFENVKVELRLLAKTVKKEDCTQVFMVDEIPVVFEELDRHYHEYSKNTAPLAVELAFFTGLRVGELVALRYQDIDLEKSLLHVHCQETKEYVLLNDEEYHFSHYEVVDYTKSDAGDRYVYLVPEAKEIIKRIMDANEINKEPQQDFLLVKQGKRINSRAVVYQLDRCLNKVSIMHKSIHKARKTYVSALIDGGLNINEIRKQVGHADVRTTYACYCYNRFGEEETGKQIVRALDFNTKKTKEKPVEVQSHKKVTTSDHKLYHFKKIKIGIFSVNKRKSRNKKRMQEMGLEPTRSCDHRHLKPARLPIPPLLHFTINQSVSLTA